MNAPEVTVRPATSEDLNSLCELYREVAPALEGMRGATVDLLLAGRSEPLEDSFSADIADPNRTVVAGVIDRIVVGFASMVQLPADGTGPIARIEQIWVTPDARGVGLGGRILTELSEQARSMGCIGIDARALPGDRTTKNFFESFGMVARQIVVYRTLDPS